MARFVSPFGHLGCLHLLPVLNNAAFKTGIQIFLWDPAFNSLRYILRNWITGLYGSSFNSWRSAILLSVVAISFYIPTNSVQVFQFLHILSNAYYFFFFNNSQFNGYEVIPTCGFDLHFSCWYVRVLYVFWILNP